MNTKIIEIYSRVNKFTVKALSKLEELGYDQYLSSETNQEEGEVEPLDILEVKF